jgi:hypothetical protein
MCQVSRVQLNLSEIGPKNIIVPSLNDLSDDSSIVCGAKDDPRVVGVVDVPFKLQERSTRCHDLSQVDHVPSHYRKHRNVRNR